MAKDKSRPSASQRAPKKLEKAPQKSKKTLAQASADARRRAKETQEQAMLEAAEWRQRAGHTERMALNAHFRLNSLLATLSRHPDTTPALQRALNVAAPLGMAEGVNDVRGTVRECIAGATGKHGFPDSAPLSSLVNGNNQLLDEIGRCLNTSLDLSDAQGYFDGEIQAGDTVMGLISDADFRKKHS